MSSSSSSSSTSSRRFRVCIYCGSQSHRKKFVSIYDWLKSHIPEIELEKDKTFVHTSTCRQNLYDLVKQGQLPCYLDNRMRGDIVKYFIKCKNPLHIFHIHRSSIIPCSENKKWMIFHSYIFCMEESIRQSNSLFTPFYLSKSRNEIKDTDIQQHIDELLYHHEW
jgi:hypothetical protein